MARSEKAQKRDELAVQDFMISVAQEGWNIDQDIVLLKLTVDAHTGKGKFLNFGLKPLNCNDGWQKLAELFNKGINPFDVHVEELKTAKDVCRILDLLKENYEKVNVRV
ncbi:uncharacterized protein [Medicago truncatula]|nr:uncharacterized protein LOC112421209 isoform X1 [Medicago truncatula]